MNRRNDSLAVLVRNNSFNIFIAVCKVYKYFFCRVSVCIFDFCGNSVVVIENNTFRKNYIKLSVNHFDICVFDRLCFVIDYYIIAINNTFTFGICHISIYRRNYNLAVFISKSRICLFVDVFNCYTLIFYCTADRICYCYSNTICISDSCFIRKCYCDCVIVIVLNISVFDSTEFIIYKNIEFIYIYMTCFIGISVSRSRKCDFAVNIGFAFFDEVCITESNYSYISLSFAVMVCDSYDNGVFSCRLNTFRKIYNYIVALTNVDFAVRNDNICLIGYCDNKGFFCFAVFFTNGAVVIVCVCSVVRNDKLTVCICISDSFISVYIFNIDCKIFFRFFSFGIERSNCGRLFKVKKSAICKFN